MTTKTKNPSFIPLIKTLYKKYRELIVYVFFGGVTTVVNIVTYFILHNLLGLENVPSNLAAWVASIVVAYFTNKIWVFRSKSWKLKTIFPEIISFIGGRLLTGGFDSLLMWLTVDVAKMPDLLWKIITNIITIVLNYFVSKFLVFRKKTTAKKS